MKKTRKSILKRDKRGASIRVFSIKPELVEKHAEETVTTVEKLYNVTVDGEKFFNKILVIVWDNPSYRPESDCGLMFDALKEPLKRFGSTVELLRYSTGDIFCGILNFAMRKLYRQGIEWGFVVSGPANSYINEPTIELFLESFCDGALVSGAAINELRESVCEGRIANTFAAWNIGRLLDVGGFALRAAMPQPSDPCKYVLRGWDEEKKKEIITIAGVEEVLPCAFLFRDNKDADGNSVPCIAPIIPVGAEGAKYNAPAPTIDPEGYARHIKKMASKFERQFVLLSSHDFSASHLKKGVMKIYGK